MNELQALRMARALLQLEVESERRDAIQRDGEEGRDGSESLDAAA